MNKPSHALATAMLLSSIHASPSAAKPLTNIGQGVSPWVMTRKGGNVNTGAMLHGRKKTERKLRQRTR